MLKIDALAHNSSLKRLNSTEKLLFTLLCITFAIGLNNSYIAGIILLVNVILTVIWGKVPAVTYIKLLTLPLGFLIAALLPIIIELNGFTPYINSAAFPKALAIALSSFASLTAMYFLALTTPFVNLAQALTRIKLPEVMLELMLLIYRYIFVMLEAAFEITVAQKSRLGYAGIKNSFRSLALLLTNLFFSAYKKANDTFTAMLARNYNGTMKILITEEKPAFTHFLLIFVYFLSLTLAAFAGGM